MTTVLDDLFGQAQATIADLSPAGTERLAIATDRFDRDEWEEVKAVSGAVQGTLEDLGQTYDYTEDLVEGMFAWLLKADPRLTPEEAMLASRKPNRKITATSADTPEATELREYTRGDPFGAAMGVVAIADRLKEFLAANAELTKAAAATQNARSQSDAARDALQAALDAAQADGAGDAAQAALEAALAAAQQAAGASAEAEADLDAQLAHSAPALRNAAKQAMKQATEQASEDQAVMTACGVEPGEARYMDFSQRAALAAVLRNGRLRAMADLIGRFRIEAAAAWAKRVEHSRESFSDVELGNDLSRALGSEIAKLAAGPTAVRLDTMRRFSQRKLLQRKYTGREKAGKGPIVAVVDTSGSMGANLRGAEPKNTNLDPTREAWAKAITFVLLDSARRQSREFYAILFASAHQQRHYHFPVDGPPRCTKPDGTPIPITPVAGNPELAATVDLIGFMFNGGTDFEAPLTQALRVIERHFDDDGKGRADIVFITDDDGYVTPQWRTRYQAAKDKIGIRTFGYAVGCTAGNTLTSVSDSVHTLANLADTREVHELFRSV